jgi:hypothetical protein
MVVLYKSNTVAERLPKYNFSKTVLNEMLLIL